MEGNTFLHFDVSVEPDKVEEGFHQILQHIRPNWEKKNVVYETSPKEYSRGLLNTMIKCHNKDDEMDTIMIRIHNVEVNQWIDRSIEVKCIKLLQPLDCAPKILASFATGFCYEFYHGEILNNTRLKEDPIWRLIATDLAKFHSLDVEGVCKDKAKAQMLEKRKQWLAAYPESLQDPIKNEIFKRDIPPKEELQPLIDDLEVQCEQLNSPLVLCHNDTRAENIIWNKEKQRIHFVDFEAMNYGHQANELAAHLARHCGLSSPDYNLMPNEEFQMNFLRHYLKTFYKFTGKNAADVTDKDVRRLYVQVSKYYLYQLIMTGIAIPAFEAMNMIKDLHEKLNLLEYAVISVKEYYKQRDRIMAMTLPS